jgi:hypothetical protein
VAQEAVIVAKIAQLVLMCKRGGGMGKLTPDVHEKGAVHCAAPFCRLTEAAYFLALALALRAACMKLS